MEPCTHRQFAVIACRNEDLLRQAEQERLAAYAIATRPCNQTSLSHSMQSGPVRAICGTVRMVFDLVGTPLANRVQHDGLTT
jgi:hypothetical protein